MALTYSEMVPLGKTAPKFKLMGIDDKSYTLLENKGKKGTVVMFICKHCPYVAAVQNRLADLANEFQKHEISFFGICTNDADQYPEDSKENLRIQAKEAGFTFPYLIDDTQEVAKAYGAVSTPDIFVFDSELKLKYRGRIDDSWKDAKKVTRQDLRDALRSIVDGKEINPNQMPSMGCSIKWKF